MRRFLISASYTQLLFDCPWPFGREDVPRFQNEAMAYGTDFHAITEALLNGKSEEEIALQEAINPEEN
ncbi:MAG TPA: hypothetical protein VGR71_09075, partial [Nitrospira sp.]|nr:hypothetical protein [Nitrospira sp.]